MRKLRAVFVALSMTLAWPVIAGATEADLRSGLAHLRAGAQAEAERDLTKYRDFERDPEVRRSIDRVIVLLRRPLAPDVREYIAATLEEAVRSKADVRGRRSGPAYAYRMFPVFP